MVYSYIQDVPIDEAMYLRIRESLGQEPMAGNIIHLCVRREDGGLRYIEVWESQEACAKAFDERVHPAVDAAFAGTRPPEPVVNHLEVLHAWGTALRGAGV